MLGRLDRKTLEILVRKGGIDTVLTVFPDGYSRLMGKRLTARHFLEHALDDGVHACIYLFTVDMEMEPLPGFTLTSWERGYGDMKLVPDLGTWRRIPWLSSTSVSTASSSVGSKKLGQPEPESNFACERKSSAPHAPHLKTPSSFT